MSLYEFFKKYSEDFFLEFYEISNHVSGNLKNPCYNPPIASMFLRNIKNKLWVKIERETGFDFKKYLKNNVYTKVPAYKLLRDDIVWFFVLLSLYLYKKEKLDNINKDLLFLSVFLLLLKYYTSLSLKHFAKYCDQTKAILAFEALPPRSLFSSKNEKVIRQAHEVLERHTINTKLKSDIKKSNIAIGCVYLYDTIVRKYYDRIKSLDDYREISKLIMVFRIRMSQSFKVFAEKYYELKKMRVGDELVLTDIKDRIHQVVSSNSQRLVYIPDDHFKIAREVSDVSVDTLKNMYQIAYYDTGNYELTFNIVNIMLSEDRHRQLIIVKDITEWLLVIRRLVASRIRYNIRSLLIQVIKSNEELSKIYDDRSDSYKHKLIQAMGAIYALSIFHSIRIKALSINADYNRII